MPTAFNIALGKAVRVQRIARGLTQEGLGALLGVTFQQIQKYERGVNRLSTETLVKVATFLSTTPQALIETASGTTAQESEQEAPPEPQTMSDRMRLETVRRLTGLPAARQRTALNVIKALEAEEAA